RPLVLVLLVEALPPVQILAENRAPCREHHDEEPSPAHHPQAIGCLWNGQGAGAPSPTASSLRLTSSTRPQNTPVKDATGARPTPSASSGRSPHAQTLGRRVSEPDPNPFHFGFGTDDPSDPSPSTLGHGWLRPRSDWTSPSGRGRPVTGSHVPLLACDALLERAPRESKETANAR